MKFFYIFALLIFFFIGLILGIFLEFGFKKEMFDINIIIAILSLLFNIAIPFILISLNNNLETIKNKYLNNSKKYLKNIKFILKNKIPNKILYPIEISTNDPYELIEYMYDLLEQIYNNIDIIEKDFNGDNIAYHELFILSFPNYKTYFLAYLHLTYISILEKDVHLFNNRKLKKKLVIKKREFYKFITENGLSD